MNKHLTSIVISTGQDARCLVPQLLGRGDRVIVTARYSSLPQELRFKNFPRCYDCEWEIMDLTDPLSVSGVITKYQPDQIYCLGALSHVGESFNQPYNYIFTDGVGPLNVLEAVRQYSKHSKIYCAGCYDKETEIVTIEGNKSIDQIEIGDLVPSLNPKNSKVQYKKVKNIIKYRYNGKMIHFHGRRMDLLVTPNHNIFYRNKYNDKTGKDELLYCDANTFKERNQTNFPMPMGLAVGDDLPEKIDLNPYIPEKKYKKKNDPEIKEIFSKDLLYLMGLYIGDGSCNIMKSKTFAHDKKDRVRNSKGQFTSKHTGTKKYKEYKCARITIDIPESDPAFKKFTDLLDRNNIKWTLHAQCDVTFFSWGLYHYLDQCGHKSHEKQIPLWIFDLNQELQQCVFDGIMDSDGSISRMCIGQTSKKLSEQLVVLAANIGYRSNFWITPAKDAKIGDRIIKGNHDVYHNKFSKYNVCYKKEIDTDLYKREKCYEIVDYNDYVWCLEVEDNHNFLICRNCKTMFCGNSSEMFGSNVNKSGFQDITTPLQANSPYAAAKILSHNLARVYRESYGLFIVSGILFNHTSIYRTPPDNFIESKVCKYVAKLKYCLDNGIHAEKLQIGNIDARRDWGYAVDYMKAAMMMLDNSEPKDYIVASGKTYSIEELLEYAFGYAGLDWKDWTEQNPKFMRPCDVPVLKGDSIPIRKELGWKPTKSFKQLVPEFIEHYKAEY